MEAAIERFPQESKQTRPGSDQRILVFPAGMPRSLTYLERAKSEGLSLIGASSLPSDSTRALYEDWVHLPFVTEPEFDAALERAVEDHDIGGVYTPNYVIWHHLHQQIERGASKLTLVNDFPIHEELKPYSKPLQSGEIFSSHPLHLESAVAPQAPLSQIEAAALLRHADVMPGMCDQDKIRALCEVARRCPPGDLVEIGSWCGKSAFVLLRLAQRYGIGKLLCVDPWSSGEIVRNDAGGLVDSITDSVDLAIEQALPIFQLNLLPYAKDDLNFLRMPSVEAAAHYRTKSAVESEAFGSTACDGRIALLHIDGNHGLESVTADLAAWGDLVRPQGWIIFDDYFWPYGDGPKTVGDGFLQEKAESIASAFVMGSALFVQLK